MPTPPADTRPAPTQSNTGHELTDAQHTAVWWSCIVEPGDHLAQILRHFLGEEQARQWVCASAPGPLPAEALRMVNRHLWDQAWNRWRARAKQVELDRELEMLHRLGGTVVTPESPAWPEGFDDLSFEAPLALWVKGKLPTGTLVAIVGARASTRLGECLSRDIAVELADAGIATVSGGAFGIDAAAHRGCLDAGAPTVAFMAGGIATPYPEAHRDLFAEIVEAGGAIVSESPPSWRPAKWRFLARNRLIAAISSGIVVVEAALRSGALATARRGLELGREVGAVPGPVTAPSSGGCHELIRSGANLIRNGTDVIEMVAPYRLHVGEHEVPLFGMPVDTDHGIDALPPAQRRTWEALPKRAAVTSSQLAKVSGLSEVEVLASLAHLELRGLVRPDVRGWARAKRR